VQRGYTTSEFISYLFSTAGDPTLKERLPSLNTLSKKLGVSVARLREQLEVARALGFVEVRPRTGIRRLPYSFFPAVIQSLAYAIQIEPGNFSVFSDLRDHIETAYWEKAVRLLEPEDLNALQAMIDQAMEKLRGSPILIPHLEHRQFHMRLFSRIDNPFVTGLLDAYWEAYEAVGLNRYTEYEYLQQVWEYHQIMVDAIRRNDYEAGCTVLLEQKNLIHHRALPALKEEVSKVEKMSENLTFLDEMPSVD
jgi:DNA-binding FadR family transcriptional regulator